jgi:hypothetical protein
MRNLRALQRITSPGDENRRQRGKRQQCYVGCLTARRRNDPKQAGLSKSMSDRPTVPTNNRAGPLPSGWALMMRAIK